MDLDKLFRIFPESKDAFDQNGQWSWTPSFGAGYPCPTYRDSGWVLMSYHPAYSVDKKVVNVQIMEMEGDSNRAIHEIRLDSGDSARDAVMGLIHACWKETKVYLENVITVDRDPLDLVTRREGKVLRDDAIEALVQHLATPHGYIEAMTTDASVN